MFIEHIIHIWLFIFYSGASVHACRKSERHFVAYEEDDLIFNNILQPLHRLSSQNPVVGDEPHNHLHS